MESIHQSIIVVGAGVFGATAALELRRRGHVVTLCDPGPLPHPLATSTDISKVVRIDYGSDEFYMALAEVAFEGWQAWNHLWEPPLFHETGFVIMARGELRPGGFEHDSFMLLQQRGHEPERLNSASLKERFPAWSAEKYPDGYFNPRAGWAESAKVVSWLLDQAQAAGVRVRTGVKFKRLLEQGSRVAGMMGADGEVYAGDCVVLAAGAWTPSLAPQLGEVMWSVGQPVLHFKVADPAAYRPPRFVPWAADIAHTGWYGLPATRDGTLKVANHGPGRSLDPDGPRDLPATEEARCRDFFRDTFPDLADAPLIGGRLCLYCDTWDGDLWIDHDPDREGLLVAAGGSGHGFKFAPVLGAIIADVLEHKPNPYAARFAWRPRGALRKEDARFEG